ncbi:MAG TPA: glycoside hydrolase family 32 protein [Tepidisphaeraceae bacterium]|nr:glycoside hydrolase family 32 protein [Tepidisphaeraceae bacterium]
MRRILLSMAAIALFSVTARGAEDLLIADFEGPDYAGWAVTGDAFGAGPAHGTLPDQHEVSGFLGKGLVNSYLGGDKSTGTLTSPEFTVGRRYINFLVGGGAHEGKTCVNLLVDSKVVRTATGQEDEHLDWATLDVGEFKGKPARIQIVDNETGGWGHINVDQIVQSDERKQQVVEASPLYEEALRPQFHFTAQKNWLNDPNGMVFYEGEYHLFFQHNPKGNVWGNMTWGHAVSPDMVHWRQLENALLPDSLGTMFSGSAVVDWQNTAGFANGGQKALVAIYTAAGDPFTQCIAFSTDRGRSWTKYDKNPVLRNIVGGNRDPKVIWHAPTHQWVMALFKDKEDYALFSSPDLKAWTLLQDLTLPGCGECPDFFPMPLDGNEAKTRWVFTAANGKYLVGDFDGKKFTPQGGLKQVDFGRNYYAVQTYGDIPESDGRRIQIAWMNGGKYPRMPFNQQMSFPCAMTLRNTPDGPRVFRLPVKEIESLYAKEHKLADVAIGPGANPLAAITGDCFDIEAEIELGDAQEVGITARGESVGYLVKEKRLTALGASAELEPANGRVKLRVLVDRTSIEAFGNDGRVSLTSCFLPKADDKGLGVFAKGGKAKIVSLMVHELRSAWPVAATK